MDDIRQRRRVEYQPVARSRAAYDAAQPAPAPARTVAEPAPPPRAMPDDTQTVSISINLPSVSFKKLKTIRRRKLLLGVLILMIFLIGFMAGRYSVQSKLPPVARYISPKAVA